MILIVGDRFWTGEQLCRTYQHARKWPFKDTDTFRWWLLKGLYCVGWNGLAGVSSRYLWFLIDGALTFSSHIYKVIFRTVIYRQAWATVLASSVLWVFNDSKIFSLDNLATGVVPGYQMDDETVRTPALFRVGGLLFVKYVLQELVDSFDTGIVPGWRLAGYQRLFLLGDRHSCLSIS